MPENLEELTMWRRQRLNALAEKLGGRAELGRKIGYKDGGFVGQMISGHRPITEKTIAAVEELPEARGWFNSANAQPDRELTEKLISHSDENNTASSLLLRLTGILESLTQGQRGAAAELIAEAVKSPRLAPSNAVLLGNMVSGKTSVATAARSPEETLADLNKKRKPFPDDEFDAANKRNKGV